MVFHSSVHTASRRPPRLPKKTHTFCPCLLRLAAGTPSRHTQSGKDCSHNCIPCRDQRVGYHCFSWSHFRLFFGVCVCVCDQKWSEMASTKAIVSDQYEHKMECNYKSIPLPLWKQWKPWKPRVQRNWFNCFSLKTKRLPQLPGGFHGFPRKHTHSELSSEKHRQNAAFQLCGKE